MLCVNRRLDCFHAGHTVAGDCHGPCVLVEAFRRVTWGCICDNSWGRQVVLPARGCNTSLRLGHCSDSRMRAFTRATVVESSWNVMAHGEAGEGKWRGNWRMGWVASTLHSTSERGVSSITTADAHTSAASSRLNWRPRRFKWTRPFRLQTKSGFCAWAITFQTQSTKNEYK